MRNVLTALILLLSFCSPALQAEESAAQTLWQSWKTRYAKPLSSGTIIIDPSTGKALSEAMAHALILAVQFNDQIFFDTVLRGLQKYFPNANGLYAWEIAPDGQKLPDPQKLISASETEINVLMALIQAARLAKNRQWKPTKDYMRLADVLENDIWRFETMEIGGRPILLPSDGKDNPYWPIYYNDGPKQPPQVAWTPTYFVPAYFKVFALSFPRHRWKEMTDFAYELTLRAVQNHQELLENDLGLQGVLPCPAWVFLKEDKASHKLEMLNYFAGAPAESTRYSNEYDSMRMPIYIGLDWFWNKDVRARKIMDDFVAYSGVNSPAQARCGVMPEYPKGFNDTLAMGIFGLAYKTLLGKSTPFSQRFISAFNPIQKCIGTAPQYYYNQTLCLYAWLIFEEHFNKECP